jgi:DNA mismatch repair protein MutS2
LERQRRRAIKLGDRVRLRSLGAQGVVIALAAEEAEVQVGVMRVRARLTDLELPTASGGSALPPAKARPAPHSDPSTVPTTDAHSKKAEISLPASPGMELDLRGRRADDALEELDRYLDAAFFAGLPFVRIIHGKGTGRLREAVRQALKDHPHVKSFENGGEKEGGDGVTVAKLDTN